MSGLETALGREREILRPIRAQADLVVDTSDHSIHDLRRVIQKKWCNLTSRNQGMRVHLISFGFKYGVPAEADMVMDLRFLPNSYFDEALRVPLMDKIREICSEPVVKGVTASVTFGSPHPAIDLTPKKC